MRTVDKILQQKGPYFNSIQSNATVFDAIRAMKTANISYLIVLEDDKYAGIVSERDYAQKVILNNKHSDTTLVREIMTTDLPIVSPDETAEQCMILMNASKSRYLPVFEDSEFIGVITIHDLMREALAENQRLLHQIHHESLQHYWI